jgi:hypothetical protein
MSNGTTARIEKVPARNIGCEEERETIPAHFRVRVPGVQAWNAPEFNTRAEAAAYIARLA